MPAPYSKRETSPSRQWGREVAGARRGDCSLQATARARTTGGSVAGACSLSRTGGARVPSAARRGTI